MGEHEKQCDFNPNLKKFPCPYCGVEFKTTKYLNRHMRSKHDFGKIVAVVESSGTDSEEYVSVCTILQNLAD